MVFLTSLYLLFSFSSAGLFNLDNTDEVSIPPLGFIYVELSSNPTTGFSWSIVDNNSEKLIFQSLEGTYNQPPPGSARGTPGTQVFQIACNDKGREGDVEHVTFVYKRPWETIPGETRIVKVTITRQP